MADHDHLALMQVHAIYKKTIELNSKCWSKHEL